MARSPIRILVFEDSSSDAYFLETALESCGYPCETVFASSHAEAKSILAARNFEMMISDFGTDIADSQAFLRAIRAQRPCLPIIVLSGITKPNAVYEAGANVFIQKTSDFTSLSLKIRSLMNFWVEVAEMPSR